MAASPAKAFVDHCFHYSCDVELEVKVHVTCAMLKCLSRSRDTLAHASGLTITAQLVHGGLAMHPTARRTQLPDKLTDAVFWNEWLTLPVKYSQLPLTAQLVIRVWTPTQQCIGGTTVRMFDERRRLKRGLQRLTLWPSGAHATPSGPTPDAPSVGAASGAGSAISEPDAGVAIQQPNIAGFYLRDERLRLAHLTHTQLPGLAAQAPWMLSLTRSQVQRALSSTASLGACICEADPALAPDKPSLDSSACMHPPAPAEFDALLVEFPRFPFPVVFEEQPYAASPFAATLAANNAGPQGSAPIGNAGVGGGLNPGALGTAQLVPVAGNGSTGLHLVHDPEITAENPVSVKYHKLARGLMRGGRGGARLIDLELRPNREEKRRIDDVVNDPSNRIEPADAALLWKFRYYLRVHKKALTKFLVCVDWDVHEEVRQALELLRMWAPIDTDDALRLLCPEYIHPEVRKYAVDNLSRASDEELSCYLLQLVQALRFERWEDSTTTDDEGLPPLARLLVNRACRSVEMATFFYWFLSVETADSATHGKMYSFVHDRFSTALEQTAQGRALALMLSDQVIMVGKLQAAAKEATKNRRQNINTKIANLNHLLSEKGSFSSLLHMDPLVLPVNPSIRVTGVVPGSSRVFRSAMYPVMVSFYKAPEDTSTGSDERKDSSAGAGDAAAHGAATTDPPEADAPRQTYQLMVKIGDDIRQDQLILQLIRLIDFQLKRLNIDLKLSPYPVLATSPKTGLLEIVTGSSDVSKVLKKGSIQEFFRANHPDPTAEYGIKAEVMDTYVKSCAGYCVITYLLGIGDRHLDNLMLQPDGHLFHIDFGWIFGRDPKPYPPPMKLTKEMVEGMGGPKNPQQSKNFQEFKKFACEAYNELRKSAHLVLNLLRLMQGCSIQDLQTDADTTIMKVQEKFRLDISREDAERTFLALVDSSVSALFPVLVEAAHRVAAMMR